MDKLIFMGDGESAGENDDERVCSSDSVGVELEQSLNNEFGKKISGFLLHVLRKPNEATNDEDNAHIRPPRSFSLWARRHQS